MSSPLSLRSSSPMSLRGLLIYHHHSHPSSASRVAAAPSENVHSASQSLLRIHSLFSPSAESRQKRDTETAPLSDQYKAATDESHADFRGTASVLSQPMLKATYLQHSANLQIAESATSNPSHPVALPGVGQACFGRSMLRADASDETGSTPSMDHFQGSSVTMSMDDLQGSSVAMSNEEQSARTFKKPRLVWTPQLHKRFIDAVSHLGVKHAVPKTIVQLMNVDGLTRENVASHLQKYRMYLKHTKGLSNEELSSSHQFFASTTPIPPSLAASADCQGSCYSQYSFGPLQNANLPSILGRPAHLAPTSSSSALPFSGFSPLSSSSMIQRAPHPPSLISSNIGKENCVPQSSSTPGQFLLLFPTSSK